MISNMEEKDQLNSSIELLKEYGIEPENIVNPQEVSFKEGDILCEDGKPLEYLYFLRNGVFLGEVKKRRFEPAQPLALLLSGDTFRHSLSLPWDDPRLNSYLKGETLELTEEEAAKMAMDF